MARKPVRRPMTEAQKELRDRRAQLKRDWFAKGCAERGLPAPTFEHRVDPARRWRLDAAWPVYRVGLEVQGGLFTGGRHVQGAALLDEMEKLNALAVAGWRVLYCVPRTMLAPATLDLVERALFRESLA